MAPLIRLATWAWRGMPCDDSVKHVCGLDFAHRVRFGVHRSTHVDHCVDGESGRRLKGVYE